MTIVNKIGPGLPILAVEASAEAAPAISHRRPTHMPALDGLRGLAIILVMVHHLIPSDQVATGGWRLFEVLRSTAWCGVDLFFVLSGFLITGILYDSKSEQRFFGSFFLRRALRIFPLQYAVLVAALVILPALHPASLIAFEGQSIWLWLYSGNLSIALSGVWHYGLLNHLWSLAVEEQFYLVWPFVVYFCSRSTLIRVCIGCIVAALAIRTLMLLGGAEWVSVYVFTPCRMDGLTYGALLALLVRGNGDGWSRYLPTIRTLGVSAAAGLTIIVVLLAGLPEYHFVVQTVGFSLLVLMFGTLVLLASRQDTAVGKAFNQPWLRFCGTYSYGLYIFNQPVDVFITHSNLFAFFQTSSYGYVLLFNLVAGTLLTFALALPSFHLFERQFLRLKKFVR